MSKHTLLTGRIKDQFSSIVASSIAATVDSVTEQLVEELLEESELKDLARKALTQALKELAEPEEGE